MLALLLAGLPAAAVPALPEDLPDLPPAPAAAQTVRLDPEQALRLALASSPALGASLARVRQAVAAAEVAAAPYRFHATVKARAEQRQEPGGPPRTVQVDGVNQVQTPETFTYNQAAAWVEMRQLIFDGGMILAEIDQLQASASASEQLAVADLHDLALEVRRAYLDVLQARGAAAVAEEAFGMAREHMRIVEARLAAGQVPRADLVLAGGPLASAELDLTRRRSQARDAEEALNTLLGLPLDADLDLAEPEIPGPVVGGLPRCLDLAMVRRPDLQAARLDLLAARKGVLAAAFQNNARMGAFATMTGVGFEGASTGGYFVGVEMSWPVLDGTLTGHLTEQARGLVDEAEALLLAERAEVEREVRRAYREVDLAGATFRAAAVQVERAREALRIVEGQYRAGRAAFPALREAGLDLVRARASHSDAWYAWLEARAVLDRACGEPPGSSSPPAPTPSGP